MTDFQQIVPCPQWCSLTVLKSVKVLTVKIVFSVHVVITVLVTSKVVPRFIFCHC